MKERPIIFTGPNVRAILEGRKTQTRRVMRPWWSNPDLWQPTGFAQARDGTWIAWYPRKTSPDLEEFTKWAYATGGKACPYGVPGDRLWCKETFQAAKDRAGEWVKDTVIYRADLSPADAAAEECDWTWTPSIFMPRWASRLSLDVTNVRVQRLQDISEEDAIAEGVIGDECWRLSGPNFADQGTASMCYANLWDSINRKKHPWASNPWVWLVTFRRLEKS